MITARSCADVLRRGGVICRPIYEAAMQFVPDSRIKDLSVKYADLEMTLGEIDRARAIFQYGSQHSDPGKVGCERQGQRVRGEGRREYVQEMRRNQCRRQTW